jgi:hypothetical protein
MNKNRNCEWGVCNKNEDLLIMTRLRSKSSFGDYVIQKSYLIGVYGQSPTGDGVCGKVFIRSPLEKPAGPFKIDHPLDPANKYISHSFVESPDMKTIYDGGVVLYDKGVAEIELTDWFGALNKDLRYQLTAVGAPGTESLYC